jgi:2-hydroxychromene-2-carboxylate isomerase
MATRRRFGKGGDVARIELFFDFISPYAYLAWVDLTRRADERGDELVLHPILFAGLLEHHGQLGPAEIPAKRQWLIRDTMRRAQRLAVDFTYPRSHPFRPLTALRLALPEVADGAQSRVVAALFQHGWERGGEMADDDELTEALNAVGLDGAMLLAKTREPAVKAALRARTDRAIELGVFGVPTMMAGTELFWGSDRIDDLFDHIDGRLPVDQRRVAEFAARAPSADRK